MFWKKIILRHFELRWISKWTGQVYYSLSLLLDLPSQSINSPNNRQSQESREVKQVHCQLIEDANRHYFWQHWHQLADRYPSCWENSVHCIPQPETVAMLGISDRAITGRVSWAQRSAYAAQSSSFSPGISMACFESSLVRYLGHMSFVRKQLDWNSLQRDLQENGQQHIWNEDDQYNYWYSVFMFPWVSRAPCYYMAPFGNVPLIQVGSDKENKAVLICSS